jgi:hypothetical protein
LAPPGTAGLFSWARWAGGEYLTLALEARILGWTLRRKVPDGTTQYSTRKLGIQLWLSERLYLRAVCLAGYPVDRQLLLPES